MVHVPQRLKADKDWREKQQKKRDEEDAKQKIQQANVVALAAAGISQPSWMTSSGTDSQAAGGEQGKGKKAATATRKITIRDLIHYLEAEQQTTKSPFLFSAYLKQK